MSAILEQLGLDRTFFVQLVIFSGLFLVLSRVFFKPFLHLFEVRRERTIEDQQAAEKLMAQAQTKLEEYKRRLTEERSAARKEFDAVLTEARKEEAAQLSHAREEAKKITQSTNDSIAKQREELRRQLERDTESLATSISERLLSRKN